MSEGSEYTTFLDGLRLRTERAWDTYGEPSANFFGPYWQRGTRWTGGIAPHALERARELAGGVLPDAYHGFLLSLHTTDRPMLMRDRAPGGRIVQVPSFTDWSTNVADLAAGVRATTDALLESVARAGTWLPAWGKKPEKREERNVRLRELIEKAPKLIPVFGHRYAVAGTAPVVLSIVGNDVIVFATSFRQYLVNELSTVLGVPADVPREIPPMPFWGELIAAL